MLNLLTVCDVDEVRREIAAIELHALDNVEFVCKTGSFFNRDDALFADFLHRLGDDLTDLNISVGRDRANLSNCFLVFARLGQFLQLSNDCNTCLIDAALEIHRIHAGRN